MSGTCVMALFLRQGGRRVPIPGSSSCCIKFMQVKYSDPDCLSPECLRKWQSNRCLSLALSPQNDVFAQLLCTYIATVTSLGFSHMMYDIITLPVTWRGHGQMDAGYKRREFSFRTSVASRWLTSKHLSLSLTPLRS